MRNCGLERPPVLPKDTQVVTYGADKPRTKSTHSELSALFRGNRSDPLSLLSELRLQPPFFLAITSGDWHCCPHVRWGTAQSHTAGDWERQDRTHFIWLQGSLSPHWLLGTTFTLAKTPLPRRPWERSGWTCPSEAERGEDFPLPPLFLTWAFSVPKATFIILPVALSGGPAWSSLSWLLILWKQSTFSFLKDVLPLEIS